MNQGRGNNDKKVIVIVGPTAVGKTELSIALAKKLDGEVISADSMQIYKGMDIGTAKPSKDERRKLVHHMIDIKDPWEEYSVALYKEKAQEKLLDVIDRGKVPIVVGGTGLYVNALIYDYSFDELPRDVDYRKKLKERALEEGIHVLYRDLQEKDLEAAKKIHPNDKKRIIRALEVIHLTGEPFSKYRKDRSESPYNSSMVGLIMNREELYRKIEERVDKMIQMGLVEETRDLLKSGCKPGMTSMQALGYKEIILYLKGELSFKEAVNMIKKNTKRFAKRQLSWFKRDPNIYWYNLSYTNLYKVEKDIERKMQEYL